MSDQYKDYSLLKENYFALEDAFHNCIRNQCKQNSFWQEPSFVIPSWVVVFAAGYLINEGR